MKTFPSERETKEGRKTKEREKYYDHDTQKISL